MANWRFTPALLLAGFLMASLFSTLAVVPRKVSAVQVLDGQVLVGDIGLKIQSHKITYEEMLESKQVVGVREPGRNYNVIIDRHGTGLAPPSEEDWLAMVGNYDIVDAVEPMDPALASLDLSASSSFPKVGNQGGQGSCAAWSATYYTYGYMESADHGWTDTKTGNPEHLMSAAWTYNKVNGGHDWGSWMSTNMWISVDWGTASMLTMPYRDWDPTSWGTMEAFREAPLHRASNVYGLNYLGPGTVDTVKALLQSGHPIAYAMDAGEFGPSFSDGNYIMSSLEYNSFTLNHAQTIVGFDDTIADDGEVGAFKIVNSWGSGWGDRGFYWMTYEAFKELGSIGVLNATYLDDIVDYVPMLLSIWHYNAAPTRSANLDVGIGQRSSPVQSKSPYFIPETLNTFPTFMALDISEFKGSYDSGIMDFFLNVGTTLSSGVISDFKIELYEDGYTPGSPTQVTGQSPSVPRSTPGYATNRLDYYSKIDLDVAFDHIGFVFSSSSMVTWVSVPSPSSSGGDAIQSGDVGDSESSDVQVTVDGPLDFWFDWRASSEAGSDTLSFSVDGVGQAAISGDLGWQTVRHSVGTGTHVLKWEFAKSSTTSRYCDCGWIDNFVIDNVPPVTSLSFAGTLGSDMWYTTAVTTTLLATDDGSGVSYTLYRLDYGIWRIYNTPFLIPSDGVHTIEYYSVDLLGNTESTKTESVKVDVTAPVTSPGLSGVLGSASWFVSAVTVSLPAYDSASGVNWTRFRLDSGPWQYDSNLLMSDDGQHTLEYQSQDLAGNLESISTFYVKIDKITPLTGLTLTGTTGNNNWYVSQVEVSLSSFDETSGIEWTVYRLDSGPWQDYTGPFNIVSDGVHNIEYYSRDFSGNQEQFQKANVKIDQSAPTLTVNQASGIIYRASSVFVSWSSVDLISGLDRIETVLDGGQSTVHDARTVSLILSGLSEGAHDFLVRAIDKAGHLTEKSVQFTVDTMPPISTASVTGPEGLNGWYMSTVTISLTAEDATTGVDSTQYRIDDEIWQDYVSPFSLASEGRHKVEYRSTDKAGNMEIVKQILIDIDAFSPITTHMLESVKGLNGWYVTSVKVTFTASDSMSGVAWTKYRLDDGDWVDYIEPFVLSVDGLHTIQFYSRDLAGRVEISESVNMKLDCAAPSLHIIHPVGNVLMAEVNIAWEGEDSTSGLDHFEIRIDNGIFQPVGKSLQVARNFSIGAHTITLRALDLAGNVAEEQLSFKVMAVPVDNGGQVNGLPFPVLGVFGILMAAITVLAVVMAMKRRKRPDGEKSLKLARPLPPPPDDLPPPPMD